MAKFKVTAEIFVEGSHIRSKRDVIDALLVMLGSHEDMDDSNTSITIRPLETKKEKSS